MALHDTVSNLVQTLLHQGWATLSSYRFDYRRSDGSVQQVVREVFDHGHGAAVLLYDAARDVLALTRQFRLPPALNGDAAMMIEACAGLLEGDTPDTCARREALEECAIVITRLEPVFTLYSSPGSVTEKVFCFIGHFDAAAPRDPDAAPQDKDEDVETLEMTLAEARAAIATGAITDAKTVALIQHLALAGKNG